MCGVGRLHIEASAFKATEGRRQTSGRAGRIASGAGEATYSAESVREVEGKIELRTSLIRGILGSVGRLLPAKAAQNRSSSSFVELQISS